MTTDQVLRRAFVGVISALALAGVALAIGMATARDSSPLSASTAEARRGADDHDRRISRFRGAGARACRVAVRRLGGGRCLKVVRKFREDDGTRYEVDVLRRGVRWEVDLSARFRVIDISRDRRRDDGRHRGRHGGDDRRDDGQRGDHRGRGRHGDDDRPGDDDGPGEDRHGGDDD